jgi:mannose-6-phosphate isomerase-like protein (cupin superfamily)
MDIVNAIAKIRFATARPQHVQLHKGRRLAAQMLCMEAGQTARLAGGERVYYVVMGSAAVEAAGATTPLPAGQLAAPDPDQPHAVVNTGEGRLVCLVFQPAK